MRGAGAETEPAAAVEMSCGSRLEPGMDVGLLESCERVSPDSEAPVRSIAIDTGIDDEDLDDRRRCGFFNLVGAAASGPGRGLFCDADLDGGVRLVEQGANGLSLLSSNLAPVDDSGQCLPVAQAGDLITHEDGSWTAAWTTERHEVVLQATGTPPRRMSHLEAQRVSLVDDALFVVAENAVLRVDPATEAAVPIDGLWARTIAAERAGRVLAVVGCGEADEVWLWREDRGITPLGVDGCHPSTQPRIAVGSHGEILAFADSDTEGGRFWFVRDDEVVEVDVESGRADVLWDGEAFLTLDGNGRIVRWSADGELLAEWRHPTVGVGLEPVTSLDLALEPDGVLWTVHVGWAERELGVHVYGFNYVEVSRVRL